MLALLALALVVRVPGIFWGTNFPIDGFGSHHPDELTHWLLAREMTGDPVARYPLPAYPKATAAPVALAIRGAQRATGAGDQPAPSRRAYLLLGRSVSVAYGTLTVLVVMLLASRFLTRWESVVAAGVATALGGLHVTQSHFFLADASALFWFTLGLYLLRRHLDDEGEDVGHFRLGAFAFGVAFGTKLVLIGLPSLAIASLLPGPRVRRIVWGAVFFALGFAIANAFDYSLVDLRQSFARGITSPTVFDRPRAALMYLTQLPGVFGLPVVLLAILGGVAFARRRPGLVARSPRALEPALTVWLPLAIATYLVLFRIDPFPRHLLTLFPWVVLFAGAGFASAQEWIRRRGVPAAVMPVVATAWMALLVFDGERNFITEPRNRAASWLLANLPPGSTTYWPDHPFTTTYKHTVYPRGESPDVIVMEMMFANHFLSGPLWRNSMPSDHRRIFGGQSPERVQRMQALFRGGSGYKEVARFGEGYFMPELTVPLRLVGDRSRSYLTEIVIFRRDSSLASN